MPAISGRKTQRGLTRAQIHSVRNHANNLLRQDSKKAALPAGKRFALLYPATAAALAQLLILLDVELQRKGPYPPL